MSSIGWPPEVPSGLYSVTQLKRALFDAGTRAGAGKTKIDGSDRLRIQSCLGDSVAKRHCVTRRPAQQVLLAVEAREMD